LVKSWSKVGKVGKVGQKLVKLVKSWSSWWKMTKLVKSWWIFQKLTNLVKLVKTLSSWSKVGQVDQKLVRLGKSWSSSAKMWTLSDHHWTITCVKSNLDLCNAPAAPALDCPNRSSTWTTAAGQEQNMCWTFGSISHIPFNDNCLTCSFTLCNRPNKTKMCCVSNKVAEVAIES
jgi:hypothetical protein